MAGKSPGDGIYAGGGTLPPYLTNARNDGISRVLLLRAKPRIDVENDQPSLPSNPFLIARSIETIIGYNNRLLVTATREARGARYVLRTQSPQAYRELMKMTHLVDEKKTEVEVVDHPTLNFVQGVVFDHDTVELGESELLNELKSEGVTAVRRITKKLKTGAIKNTPLIVLTFRGTQRPEHIMFGMLRVNVRPYYPGVLLCRNCAAYGHSGKYCTSPAVCLTCSQSHEIDQNEPCPNPPHCCHCDGGHSPVSKDCPVFRKEEAVIRLRVDRGITYQEARAEIEQCAPKTTTYASKVQERLDETSDKDREIRTLRTELQKIREEMKNYLAMKKELDIVKKQLEKATSNTGPSLETTTTTLSTSSMHQDPSDSTKMRLSRMDSGKSKQVATPTIQPQLPKPSRADLARSASRKRYLYSPPTPNQKKKRNRNRKSHEDVVSYEQDDDPDFGE